MPETLPALSLVATPGRRRAVLDLAREIERRGFDGIFVPSFFSSVAQCSALALATKRIRLATVTAPIHARTVEDFAQNSAYIHEISGGRFIGIAYTPSSVRMGVMPGKPLADLRAFVARVRASEAIGALPPIILAALRPRMVALAGEIADGVILGNVSRSHMPAALAVIPAEKRHDADFIIANAIPTCVSDDIEAAKAVARRTLTRYTMLPNYRDYWKEAGYVEEMTAIETAVAEGRRDDVPKYLPDRWLADCTLFGRPTKIRDGVEAWRTAGIKTPILVPLSADGDQNTAIRQVFAAF